MMLPFQGRPGAVCLAGVVLVITVFSALALVHLIGTRLPLFSIIPLFRWTSFAGGVSITYGNLE